MNNFEINTKEYWNNRFEEDWRLYGGNEQTRFFASIACSMIPDFLKQEIQDNKYLICDIGCGEGDALGILHRFFAAPVMGMDFSEKAIEKGRKKHPGYELVVRDIRTVEDVSADVVFCSNVMEHFPNPWDIFESLEGIAQKYIILCVPYKEKMICKEHLYVFNDENILMQGKQFHLIYEDTLACGELENSCYPEQQILLVYAREGADGGEKLCNISKGMIEEKLRDANREYEKKYHELKQEYEARCQALRAEHELKQDALKKEMQKYQEELQSLQKWSTEAKTKLQEMNELKAQNQELQKMRTIGEEQNRELKNIEEELREKIEFQENLMFLAKSECFRYNSRTIYKLFRMVYRFREQFMRGNYEDRRNFRKLLMANLTRKRVVGTRTDGFNPMYNIINILDGVEYGAASGGKGGYQEGENGSLLSQREQLDKATKAVLREKYDKPDIIIFAVIDYNFRHQRPQHFATRFAANGHRVFYINANFTNGSQVKEIADNLFVVDFATGRFNAIYETDWSQETKWLTDNLDKLIGKYAVRDAVVVVDYPNWINGADYLKRKYGFFMVTDYMDDFTGFLGTTTNILKDNCIKLLEHSDLVVPSSQFLHDIAVKYAKRVEIVRNGTEVDHFYRALEMEYHRERKVIGYYGAVAHWFAWEKVCYVAQQLPECDVVIIGAVTEHREQLEKYSNIKLLGELPYEQLPEHLAYFDVCLIPFDTSTDLIKATNPVKFYEYLSAGKRVVATDIPELEPFRDEYVYMSNDDAQFLEYVKLCLDGKDTLKGKAECVAFAKENDWQKRFEGFERACFEVIPKISIIMLTYNNLELNKACIKSILDYTAYPNYELIIVDNQSSDGTVEYLREIESRKDSRIRIIFNTENSGFAGGNNKGIKEADGEYIMLLNNDTVVTRGWLTNMVKHLKQDSRLAMCGAVTNSIGNEAQICAEYTNTDELQEFSLRYTQAHMGEEYKNVDRIALFCTLIPKTVFDRCGLLDEGYKVGMFEDDDFAQAVMSQGYEFVIAEDVFVHHVNNASFKKLDEEKYNEIFESNKKLFEEKWNVKWTYPKYREGVDWNSNAHVRV